MVIVFRDFSNNASCLLSIGVPFKHCRVLNNSLGSLFILYRIFRHLDLHLGVIKRNDLTILSGDFRNKTFFWCVLKCELCFCFLISHTCFTDLNPMII
uniref:Uncharacterized protein n=1 Tax=Arundo donax TaxID=35708 RepID=A0A0A9HPV4_ARUDO